MKDSGGYMRMKRTGAVHSNPPLHEPDKQVWPVLLLLKSHPSLACGGSFSNAVLVHYWEHAPIHAPSPSRRAPRNSRKYEVGPPT